MKIIFTAFLSLSFYCSLLSSEHKTAAKSLQTTAPHCWTEAKQERKYCNARNCKLIAGPCITFSIFATIAGLIIGYASNDHPCLNASTENIGDKCYVIHTFNCGSCPDEKSKVQCVPKENASATEFISMINATINPICSTNQDFQLCVEESPCSLIIKQPSCINDRFTSLAQYLNQSCRLSPNSMGKSKATKRSFKLLNKFRRKAR